MFWKTKISDDIGSSCGINQESKKSNTGHMQKNNILNIPGNFRRCGHHQSKRQTYGSSQSSIWAQKYLREAHSISNSFKTWIEKENHRKSNEVQNDINTNQLQIINISNAVISFHWSLTHYNTTHNKNYCFCNETNVAPDMVNSMFTFSWNLCLTYVGHV